MAVIFLQPPDPSPSTLMGTVIDQNAPFPAFGPPGVSRMMTDDFLIGDPATLTSINFWGYFWTDTLPPAAPTYLPIIHMEIYPDVVGSPGPVIWSSSAIGEFGPLGAAPYTQVLLPIFGPGGWFYDTVPPVGPGNPLFPGTTLPLKYSCPIPGGVPLTPGVFWLSIQVDLAPTSTSTAFGWSNMDPLGSPVPPGGAMMSPVPFLGPGGPWVPVPYPTGHPLAAAPMNMAFELEGTPLTTTTTAPAGTTTAPAGTTTAPPVTTPPPDWHATATGLPIDPSQVTFGTPAVPPIPADFFEPGSDPFTGVVELEGDPIGPEDTSTVVRRDADPFAPGDPPGGPSLVSIEIIALQLRSVAPITVTLGGPATQWDVSVDLSVTPAAPGTLSATKTHANGGTFDAQFLVQPRFTFTKVSGPGIPISSVTVLDTGLMAMPPLQFLGSGDWVHSVNDPLIVHAPGAQWISLIDEVIPGLPSSQTDSPMAAETLDTGPSARHVVVPPRLPIPTTTSPCECNLTVDEMPPEGCEYSGDPWVASVGLPPGDTIVFNTIWMDFVSIARVPGGTLGGEVETFDSTLDMTVSGTGSLSGFSRHLSVPLTCEVHTGPRVKTSPSQSFDQVAINLQGELFGDPDFCIFRVKAGFDHGLPSPGHTLLEKLGGGDFAVDSFFDISYTIEFQGCPGSQLDGLSGTTPGASQMRTGAACLTTAPATTAPATTTGPPFTTPPPTPGTTPHPSDAPGPNWRISSSEILSYAAAWLSNDDLVFPGIPAPNRSAYVLRAAAIFLANFQARYEDIGAAAPWGDPLHAQRWQELADI